MKLKYVNKLNNVKLTKKATFIHHLHSEMYISIIALINILAIFLAYFFGDRDVGSALLVALIFYFSVFGVVLIAFIYYIDNIFYYKKTGLRQTRWDEKSGVIVIKQV